MILAMLTIIIIILAVIIVIMFKKIPYLEAKETVIEYQNLNKEKSLDDLIKEKAEKYGIELRLIRAIIKVESNFNPSAINLTDPSYGLCQVMPALAKGYGFAYDIKSLVNPDHNLNIALTFLKDLKQKYSGDLKAIIQAYNLGETKYNKGLKSPEYLEKVLYYYYKGI